MIDSDSHRQKGVFVAAYELLESGKLNQEQWTYLRELLIWFNEHLPHPPDKFGSGRATVWFRAKATGLVEKIWEIVWLLREHGHHVEVQKCSLLANVCYEDKFQVAAYPSSRDGKITAQ